MTVDRIEGDKVNCFWTDLSGQPGDGSFPASLQKDRSLLQNGTGLLIEPLIVAGLSNRIILKPRGVKDVLESTEGHRTAGRHGNQHVRLRGAHLIYLPTRTESAEPSVTAQARALNAARRTYALKQMAPAATT